jgi:hypothetical protein
VHVNRPLLQITSAPLELLPHLHQLLLLCRNTRLQHAASNSTRTAPNLYGNHLQIRIRLLLLLHPLELLAQMVALLLTGLNRSITNRFLRLTALSATNGRALTCTRPSSLVFSSLCLPQS